MYLQKSSNTYITEFKKQNAWKSGKISHRTGHRYFYSTGPTFNSVVLQGQWKIQCTGPYWPGGLKSAQGQWASAYVEGWNIWKNYQTAIPIGTIFSRHVRIYLGMDIG